MQEFKGFGRQGSHDFQWQQLWQHVMLFPSGQQLRIGENRRGWGEVEVIHGKAAEHQHVK